MRPRDLPLLALFALAAGCEILAVVGNPEVYPGGSGGTGGGGEGGGAGGDAPCPAGATQKCPYTGPDGSENVGVCVAGKRTCNADGTAWSACEGEVTPMAEDCSTPEDDDCDGEAADADAGCVCVPGELLACYSGPVGTETKGLCHSGMQQCSASGLGFGPCEGEQLPVAEDCANPADEDCDGLSPPCKGTALWAKRFGDDNDQFPRALAVDGAGNILLAGYFFGSVDFGGGPITSQGANDVFVAKLAPDGSHLWSKRFGDTGAQDVISMAVDKDDNILITGSFTGSADFGGGSLSSAGTADVFVAKLAPGGAHIWSKSFGDASPQTGKAIAADPEGNILVSGAFAGSLDFGGSPLNSAGSTDIFLVKFTAQGSHLWAKRYGDSTAQAPSSVAVDGGGNVLLTGAFTGTIDLGAGALSSVGGPDLFLAKIAANGDTLWSKRFGDGNDYVGTVLVAPDNDVLLTGSFSTTMDFGGEQFSSQGDSDAFVARLDAGGAHVSSVAFSAVGPQDGERLAVDANGNIFVAGAFGGTVDFGGGPLPSVGESNLFLVKLDTMGNHIWSKTFGDDAGQGTTGIVVDKEGTVIATGLFLGTLDFGAVDALTSAGASDIFLVKFSP